MSKLIISDSSDLINIADAIREKTGENEPLRLNEMPEKIRTLSADGPGGASHWNELEGKPFVTVGGDTLEWDGNTEGKPMVSIDEGAGYVKISDATPSITDFANGFSFTASSGESYDIPAEVVKDFSGEGIPVIDTGAGYFIVLEENAEIDGIVFTEVGTYAISADGYYLTSLTIPGYTGFTKEQIDPAVLPDALQFGDKMTEIMPETELTGFDQDGIYLLFLESFPEADECHVTFDGVKYTCKKISLDGDIAYGNLSILGAGDDTGEPFILCMGCAIVNDDAPHTVGISEMRATPIDEKYIPPRKTFYVKYNDASDIYLYTDKEKITKATMEDVKAADEMHGIRIETGLGMWATPLIVKTGVSSGNGAHDYAMVGVVNTLNGDTATFAFYYTDKYTAS